MADPVLRGDGEYIRAGAVFVMPEPGASSPRPFDSRTLSACGVQAERIEREALGSPIAQDAARRIRLAILALADRGAGSEIVEEAR